MGTPFDPDAYLKKKTSGEQAPAFDPDAYLAKANQPQAEAPKDRFSGLKIAREINSLPALARKQGLKKEALKRFLERNDTEPDKINQALENVNAFFPEGGGIEEGALSATRGTPEKPKGLHGFNTGLRSSLNKGDKLTTKSFSEIPETIGDALYSFANFGNVIPAGVAAGESLTGDKSLGENYEIEKLVSDLRKRRSPVSSTLGEMASYIAPYSAGMKILSKAPIIGKGAAGASKFGEVLKTITRGGLVNPVIGQLQGHDLSEIPKDIAFGAGGEAVGQLVSGTYNLGKKALNKIQQANESGVLPEYLSKKIPYRSELVKNAKEVFDKEVTGKIDDLRDLRDAAEKSARATYDFNKSAARNALRDLSEVEPAELGERFLNKVKESKGKLSQDYASVADPLMKRLGSQNVSVEPLRKQLTQILKENQLLDDAGNIDLEKINLIHSPARKQLVNTVANITSALKENPTLKSLNSLKQDLQSLATNSPIKTPEQGAFTALSKTAKDTLDDAMGQLSPDASSDFQAVRRKYAEQKPTLDYLRKKAEVLPERLVINTRVQFPKSKIQKILKTNPEFKKEIGDFIFEHFTQTPATQNTIRKTMDYYGRDFLEDLLGPERFKALSNAESNFIKANKVFDSRNIPNPEAQAKIGEILGPDSMGPYSFDSAKKQLRNSNFKDPIIEKIQNKISKIIGSSKSKPKTAAKMLEFLMKNSNYLGPAIGSQVRGE